MLALWGGLPACSAEAPQATMAVKAVGPTTSRTLNLTVMAPSGLAGKRAFLASESDVPLITRGGQFLGPDAAGVPSAAYVLAQGGPRYLRVERASVQLQTLAGKPATPTVFTDGAGVVAIPIGKNAEPLAALTALVVDGRVYRLSTILPADAPGGAYMVDPLTTLIDAAFRHERRKPTSGSSYERLRDVWSALDAAGVEVAAEDLRADLPTASAQARLREVWQAAIDNQLVTERDKAQVAAFLEDLARP